jgi:DNA helicase HerA-like ATPase
VKGDLSGIAAIGEYKDFLEKRAKTIGLDPYEFQEFPVIFWDLFGEKGHRVRTTISEMGPLLLARLMDMSDAQEGVLNIAFKLADENGLPLLDLKDLRALLNYMAGRPKASRPCMATSPSSRWRDPARAAGARAAGRRAFLRRAGAEDCRHHAHHQ